MEVALCTSKSDEVSICAANTISPGSSNSNLQGDTLATLSPDYLIPASTASSSCHSSLSSTVCCTNTLLSMTTSIATQIAAQAHSTLVASMQTRLQFLQPDNIDLDSSTVSLDPGTRASPSVSDLRSSDKTFMENFSSCVTQMVSATRSEAVTIVSSSSAHPNLLPAATSNSSQPSPESYSSTDPLTTSNVPSKTPSDELIDIVDLSNDENSTPPTTQTPESSWTVSSSNVSGSPCSASQVITTNSKTSMGEKSTSNRIAVTTNPSPSLVMEAPVSLSSKTSPITLTNALLSTHGCNHNKTGGLVSNQFITSLASVDPGSTQSVSSHLNHSSSPCMPTAISSTGTHLPGYTSGLTSFRPPTPTDLAAISSTPRVSMPPTPTPLPPHFPFTLSPISPNGDFPAVHFSLPGFPMVILQVLPLPGARMGEHYTINVPTQLILNGVASAIANGGTVNGGPIVLSIAPSGTLPPGVVPPPGACLPSTGNQSVATTLPETSMLTMPTDSLTVSTSGTTTVPTGVLNQSSSVPCSVTNFSNPVMSSNTSAVIHNALTNVQFPGFVLSPTSAQANSNTNNNNNNNTGKRMRAIAPKPCQKMISAIPNTTAISNRTSSTTSSKGNTKRQNNAVSSVVVSCTTTMPITSTVAVPVTSGMCGIQTISCSKTFQTKRVSIMPTGTTPSAARHGRGRRKSTNPVLNNLAPLISPMTLSNGLSCQTPTTNSTTSIVTNTNNEPCMTTRNSLQQPPTSSHIQQPNPVQSMFSNQPLLVSNPNAPQMLAGPMMPTGQMPPTFLFGGPMSTFPPTGTATGTSTSASGAPSYIFQQPLPLPNGCSQFPVSMYNSVSCATSMPLSTTSAVSMVRSFQTANSGSLFPSGAPTALATVDPSSGMITHFPAPCMPMAVPYSSNNGASTDQNSFAALSTMMYSQPGLLLPNVSQPGSMVYPVPGQSLLTNTGSLASALPHAVTSTASMMCSNQPGLAQPFSTAFISNCSSGTLLPNSTLPNSLRVPSTFAPLLAEQQAFLPSLAGFDPMQSQQHTLLASCTTTANNNQHDVMESSCSATSLNTITVNLDDDSNNISAKDDLITLAWQLTQLKSSEMNTSLMNDGCQQQQEHLNGLIESAENGDVSGSGGMLDALFDNYADDREAYITYSTDELTCDVLSEVDNTRLGAITSANLTEETDEIVLLDRKSSPFDDMAPPGTESQMDSGTYANTTEESTGNADIDALLAAAAMVSAASGVGDAQSAVTVTVPCSSALTATQQLNHQEHKTMTVCHSTTPSSDTTVSSIAGSMTICTTSVADGVIRLTRQLTPDCGKSKAINTASATVAAGTPPTDIQINSPKDADDILSADFFTEFSHEDNDELRHFTEVDEPTSLADVLGCNPEDAADLESVLGPEAHQLGGADHVPNAFLNSLVNDSPGLGLDAADEDDDVGEAAHHLFDSDFAECVADQLDEVPESTTAEKHQVALPAEQFELDFDSLTKSTGPLNSCSSNPPVPSSQQVRSLFRNTTTTAASLSVAAPGDTTTTVSDDSKLLSRLFDTSTSPQKRRANKALHRATPEDDFLCVNFADTDGDYTTAEQFNEALLLLGPQPSPPDGHQNHPIYYAKSIEEPADTKHQSPKSDLNTLSENATVDKTSIFTQGIDNQTTITVMEQECFVELQQVELDPVNETIVKTAEVTVVRTQPKLNVTVKTITLESPDFYTSILETGVIDDSIEVVAFELISDDHLDRVAVSIPDVIDSEVTTSIGCEASAAIDNTESIELKPCPKPEKSHVVIITTDLCSASDTKGVESDEEATLAMRLEPTELLGQVTPLVSAGSNVDLVSTPDEINKRPMDGDTRPTKQLRTRSISLNTPLELATSTPTRSCTNIIFSRHSRRRLFSAPSQVVASPRARQTRNSSSCRPYAVKPDSVSQPSGSSSNSTTGSRKLSSGDAYSTESKLISTQSSSLEQCSELLTDDTNTEPMQPQSILTVLASSSALLEAAAVDLASDSDVSPIKSSLGQLETLDRMLKNCQRRSQRQALDTTGSKSSETTSSVESDVTLASQSDLGQTTVLMSCTQFEVSDEKPFVPVTILSTLSSSSCPEGESAITTSPITIESQTMEPVTKSRPGRRKAAKRGKRSNTHRKSTNTNLTRTDHNLSAIDLPVVEGNQVESNESGLATVGFNLHDTITTSATSLTSTILDSGLLFCTSERPHSFGLSSEEIASVQATYNPVPNGDFSQHLPRLTLAISGPLFPDLPPSPTDIITHECDLCKAPVCEQLQRRSSPLERQRPQQNNSPQVMSSQNEQFTPDVMEFRTANTSNSCHMKHKSRKRRKRSRRSRSLGKVVTSVNSKADELHVGFVPQSTFDSAIIVPFNLTKPPASDAPFARFANSELLPTFADIHSGNVPVDRFSCKSNSHSSALIPVTCSRPSSFVDQTKKFANEPQTETLSLSPPNTLLDVSSDMAEAGSDRISVNSTMFHDDDKWNPGTSCCPSDRLSRSPQPLTVSSFSPLRSQLTHTQPTTNIPSFGHAPQSPNVVASLQQPKTNITVIATSSIPNALLTPPGSSVLDTNSAFHAKGASNTAFPNLKLSTVSGFSQLSIPTTRIAGVTFGSFAGAAAFRSTSFSALAAKAESNQHKPGSGLLTKQLTFSDLAKAASQLDTKKPTGPATTSSNNTQWTHEDGQNSAKTFPLFLNCAHTKTASDRPAISPDSQTRSCGSPSSIRGNLSMGASNTLSHSEDDSVLSKLTASDPSLSMQQSPTASNLANSLAHRVRRGSFRKGSRRRRGSRRALRSTRKPNARSQQLSITGPGNRCLSLSTSPKPTVAPESNPFIANTSESMDLNPHPSEYSPSQSTSSGTREPKPESMPETIPDALTDVLSINSCGTHQSLSPIEIDEHKESKCCLTKIVVSHPQLCASLDENHLSGGTEVVISRDEITLSPKTTDSNPVCVVHGSPSCNDHDIETEVVSTPHPEFPVRSSETNGTTASSTLIDEIITLPLDKEDYVTLIQSPTAVVASNDANEEPPDECLSKPTNELIDTATEELKVSIIQSEPDIAPPCEDSSALNQMSPEKEELTFVNGSMESTTEQNATAISNLCPPIRLRLSLKSTLHNYSTVHSKKSKRLKQPPAEPLVAVPLLSDHYSNPVTAVISSRTPTSLSIRLTPKPKLSVVPVVQPLPPPQQPRSLNLEIQQTPNRSKRPGSGHRKRRAMRGRKSDQACTVSVNDHSNPGMAHTTGSVAPTAGVPVGYTQSYAVTSSTITTRSAPVTRSCTAPCPTSRTAYPPRLASVFAKKIFSTAKQDRRSSYAHLSQPWRSGIRGSPRKRGFSRAQSTTLSKTVTPAQNVSSSPVVRGASRRGRIAIRSRGALRGVRRLGKRTLSIEHDLTRKRGGSMVRTSHPAEPPPAIRLVIRLGKRLQHPRSVELARTSSLSPNAAHSPSDDSSSEPEGATLVRMIPDTTQGARFYVNDVGNNSDPDCDHLGQEDEEEPNKEQEVDGSENVRAVEEDLNSTDELLSFEFCTATEAETYMDPNQVRIHRIVNRALMTNVPVGECFLDSDDEDKDDGITESLVSTVQKERLVSMTTFADHMDTKRSCLPHESTCITNTPCTQMGYATISCPTLPLGDHGKQKRKKRSERHDSNDKPDPTMVVKRRCSGPTTILSHSPMTLSDSSYQPQVLNSPSLTSVNQHPTTQTDNIDVWNPQLSDAYDTSRSDVDPITQRLQPASSEERLSNLAIYSVKNGSTTPTQSDVYTSVAGPLGPETVDLQSYAKLSANLAQYSSIVSKPRPSTAVPPITSYVSVHHLTPHPPTFGAGSGTGTSCGEGRSSSSTSSIVSVPALASVGSPGPDSQSDYAATAVQYRLAQLDESVTSSPLNKDECGLGLPGKLANPFTNSQTQSTASPSIHCMDQRTASTDTLQIRSPYGAPDLMDGAAKTAPCLLHSPQSLLSTSHIQPPAVVSVPHANNVTQSSSSVCENEAPATAMHQQALAAVTAYAAAAAYAGLDRMMPSHQHVKAYYDQWATSLFGSLATNPSELQPQSTLHHTDWSQTAAERISDTRQFHVTDNNSTSSWVWNNQRTTNFSRSGTLETDSRSAATSDYSSYNNAVAAGSRFDELINTANSGSPRPPALHHQHSSAVHISSSVATDSVDYGATGHPITIGSSYPEHQLPHMTTHPDPYRHFHPGLDYARRFGSDSVHEPRVNGW